MEIAKISQEDPDFTYEGMMKKFKEMSEDKTIHFQTRDKFEHLHKILGEHKFWNN